MEPQKLEVLLVEDDAADVDLAKMAVEDGNIPFVINVVEDGIKALEYLQKEGEYKDAPRPHLVIMDFNLPKKNGREVLHTLKKDSVLKNIPVFLFSTTPIPDEVLKEHQLNESFSFTKPLHFNEYIAIMKSIEGTYRKKAGS